MIPNYDLAATKALETLKNYKITETPIDSLSILLKYPGVRVISFTKFAVQAGIERHELVPMFGGNQDAATFNLDMPMDGVNYVVVYNMRLPHEIILRGVARELGHIVLGHDGQTRPTEVRMKEAMCFAHHLLSPRPIIQMIRESVPLTLNVLTDTTGCSEDCVSGLRNIPGVHVPPELNRQIKEQFSRGIEEYIQFYKASEKEDKSPLIDFGTFMDNYEE